MPEHKAGFVTIIGKPNAGKSTLLNALAGFKISAVTPKASTTRHSIMGFVNGDDFQIVFLDTPGVIKEVYKLHERMMTSVAGSLKDADVILLLLAPENSNEDIEALTRMAMAAHKPIVAVLNKLDKTKKEDIARVKNLYTGLVPGADLCLISASQNIFLDQLVNEIKLHLPIHEPYYDKEDITDRNMRFIVAEIIREQLFMLLAEELPYVSTVLINEYKEKPEITVIRADVIVEKESQKMIIIGKDGNTIKKIGTAARKAIEAAIETPVFLDMHVKVQANWRDNDSLLKYYGYTP